VCGNDYYLSFEVVGAGALPRITVAATHGLFMEGARDKLARDSRVREVFVTDTVPVKEEGWPQLRVVCVAPLLAAAIRRFLSDGSLDDSY
jgi:ribose-phosphate pyrophosphokinase